MNTGDALPSADGPRCVTCGAALLGDYCHACGEKRVTPGDLTVRHFVNHVVDEVLQLDSRTLRSVRGLFRPGYLTTEYVAGRRKPYLAPLKLYLVCAAAFFLMAPFVGFNFEMFGLDNPQSPLAPIVASRMAESQLDRARFVERFDVRFQTVYTIGLSASMLGAALLLTLLYRKRRFSYGVHQVFAMHWVSVLYLATIVLFGLQRLTGVSPGIMLLVGYMFFAPYMFLAIKRVYRETTAGALVKAVTVLAFAYVLDSLVTVAIMLITLAIV